MSHSNSPQRFMNLKISKCWKIMIFEKCNIFDYAIFIPFRISGISFWIPFRICWWRKTLKKWLNYFLSMFPRGKKSENEKWFAQHLQFSRFENLEISKNHRKKHILVIGDCIVFTSKCLKIASFEFHQPPVPRRASPRAFWRKRRARRLRFECTPRNIISITFKACRSV